MKKKLFISGLIALLLITAFCIGRCSRSVKESNVNDTIAPKIEQIVIKNDSLLRVNDSINFKVIEIEKTYEKTIDDIIRNNPDDDYDFFSTYIERYCGQHNTDTTKNSKSDIR